MLYYKVENFLSLADYIVPFLVFISNCNNKTKQKDVSRFPILLFRLNHFKCFQVEGIRKYGKQEQQRLSWNFCKNVKVIFGFHHPINHDLEEDCDALIPLYKLPFRQNLSSFLYRILSRKFEAQIYSDLRKMENVPIPI